MDGATDAMRSELETLEGVRRALTLQLEPHEAWRALRQLDERERLGHALSTIDGGQLRSRLSSQLDQIGPAWRALPAIEEAIRLLSGLPPASAPLDMAAPSNIAEAVRRPLPIAEAAPTVAVISSQPPMIPSEPRSDLSRIRLIDKIALATGSRSAEVDRFGGVVPWAMLGSPPPAADALTRAATGPAASGSTSGIDREVSAPLKSTIAELKIADFDVAARSVSIPGKPLIPEIPKPAPIAITPTPQPASVDRLSALEVDVARIVADAQRKVSSTSAAASDRSFPSRRTVASQLADDDRDLDVEEAEVEIVRAPRRDIDLSETVAPARLAASPPVALSIRLKQPEHNATLDHEAYAAYRDDVGEAVVEIVQPGPRVATVVATVGEFEDRQSERASTPRPAPVTVHGLLKTLTQK